MTSWVLPPRFLLSISHLSWGFYCHGPPSMPTPTNDVVGLESQGGSWPLGTVPFSLSELLNELFSLWKVQEHISRNFLWKGLQNLVVNSFYTSSNSLHGPSQIGNWFSPQFCKYQWEPRPDASCHWAPAAKITNWSFHQVLCLVGITKHREHLANASCQPRSSVL